MFDEPPMTRDGKVGVMMEVAINEEGEIELAWYADQTRNYTTMTPGVAMAFIDALRSIPQNKDGVQFQLSTGLKRSLMRVHKTLAGDLADRIELALDALADEEF
jgi:hypothetical protein